MFFIRPREVNYEQSIVAPAADLLLSVYIITADTVWLEAAKLQLDILDLFNGFQPDYHLHETAIRHWDGYWFGKRRIYGEYFPAFIGVPVPAWCLNGTLKSPEMKLI